MREYLVFLARIKDMRRMALNPESTVPRETRTRDLAELDQMQVQLELELAAMLELKAALNPQPVS